MCINVYLVSYKIPRGKPAQRMPCCCACDEAALTKLLSAANTVKRPVLSIIRGNRHAVSTVLLSSTCNNGPNPVTLCAPTLACLVWQCQACIPPSWSRLESRKKQVGDLTIPQVISVLLCRRDGRSNRKSGDQSTVCLQLCDSNPLFACSSVTATLAMVENSTHYTRW